MILQNIIDRSVPPQPWADGEKIPWNDPEFSKRMLNEHLSQAHDAASRRFPIIEQHVDWISRTVLAQKTARILDLGCGPGLYTERLARLGHDCVGIDFAPAAIAYAKTQAAANNLLIDYRHADIRRVNYGADFDLIMLINGEFNTFRPAEAKALLRKSWQALKNGGRILLEPHTFDGVRRQADRPTMWRAAQSGLFSDEPHLWLEERFWDAESQTTITRHYIIDAATAAVTRHAETLQAYAEAEYQRLLAVAGFQHIQSFPSLTGEAEPIHDDMCVLVAQKV